MEVFGTRMQRLDLVLPGWREVPVDIVKTVGETELQNFVKFKEEMVGVQVVDCENILALK